MSGISSMEVLACRSITSFRVGRIGRRVACLELNALALDTGTEHGIALVDGIPGRIFTSGEMNRARIPASLPDSGHIVLLHSHTNCTPFSAADLAWLTNPDIGTIGIISSNEDEFTASVGEGYLIDPVKYRKAADTIALYVDMEMPDRPDFYDWTIEQRKYMAIREQMLLVARHFHWTLRGRRP